MVSVVWEMTQHWILVAYPSTLSPELPTPEFSPMSLVYSALLPLEPMVSSYKQNFVQWPLKSVSLAISLWWTETVLLLTPQYYVGTFTGLVL